MLFNSLKETINEYMLHNCYGIEHNILFYN
jgi:hypothetical protein